MTDPATVLARAFFTDPFATYVEPDEHRRAQMLQWLMGCWVRACELTGYVQQIEGRAVAGWMAPGRHGFTDETMQAIGMDRAREVMGAAAHDRMLKVEDDLEQFPPSARPQEAWYLLAIGVDPDHQGEGLSRTLITHGIERARRDGLPVRLETNSANNVELYQHLGFELVAERHTPGLIPQWGLLLTP